jgi:DUF1009 family protein
MQSVKASVLALEAGKTVLLDRDVMLDNARRAGIAVVGIATLESSPA